MAGRPAATARPGLRVSAEVDVCRAVLVLAIAVGTVGLTLWSSSRFGMAQDAEFTTEYLGDPENIAMGKAVWLTRCKFCHGKTAYPGKGPKLRPSRYSPEFVYDRVTNGFRGMPAWKEAFSEEERRAVVAYVMSRGFSN